MASVAAVAAGSQAVMAISSSYAQSEAQKQQADFQKQQFDANARMAEIQGEDAKKRGDEVAAQAGAKARRLAATQRTEAGASGIDATTGSAGSIENDTATLGALDQLTIRNNAWKEAWGFKSQALQYSAQGQFAQMSGYNQAQNTLITGGMQAVGYGGQAAYYRYQGQKTTNSTTTNSTTLDKG